MILLAAPLSTAPAEAATDITASVQANRNVTLSGDASKEELDFLKSLRLEGRKPTPLFYYRALQNLRDPLHFRD